MPKYRRGDWIVDSNKGCYLVYKVNDSYLRVYKFHRVEKTCELVLTNLAASIDTKHKLKRFKLYNTPNGKNPYCKSVQKQAGPQRAIEWTSKGDLLRIIVESFGSVPKSVDREPNGIARHAMNDTPPAPAEEAMEVDAEDGQSPIIEWPAALTDMPSSPPGVESCEGDSDRTTATVNYRGPRPSGHPKTHHQKRRFESIAANPPKYSKHKCVRCGASYAGPMGKYMHSQKCRGK